MVIFQITTYTYIQKMHTIVKKEKKKSPITYNRSYSIFSQTSQQTWHTKTHTQNQGDTGFCHPIHHGRLQRMTNSPGQDMTHPCDSPGLRIPRGARRLEAGLPPPAPRATSSPPSARATPGVPCGLFTFPGTLIFSRTRLRPVPATG